ncbi:hypothetical protein LEMA_P019340.1 [Plenodomus lingam JN3]|uniref:Uncharacterized protein n=1 Tax=Leptosphaeria maculans (strain JN3 / isolate v23.1.3 / race Av1-4-5-6-7-8) TaxID=985895 RepID=E5AAW3_LEPMJ|nr:hypothetical protein LEMA_P019340.1 [Plenodomus lingam JN3]CBY00804.1 hypothetical protein LEMA_P019340.1 [Plenodomus lingam JN3]
MLFMIGLSILLLPLSSAILGPPLPSENIVPQHIGCHDRFNANSEMIFFRYPSDHAFEYAVITPYKKYYPRLLEYALKANNFQLAAWQNNQACGWQKRDHAIASSNTSDKIIVRSPSQLPSNATMDKIRHILFINPPAGDVYELITILLCYLTGSMICFVLLIFLKHCIEREERFKSTNTKTEVEELELEAFRPLNTSIIPMARASRATLPTDCCKSLQYEGDSAWSFDANVSELPPSPSVSRG